MNSNPAEHIRNPTREIVPAALLLCLEIYLHAKAISAIPIEKRTIPICIASIIQNHNLTIDLLLKYFLLQFSYFGCAEFITRRHT
jgi:hypothetical protein